MELIFQQRPYRATNLKALLLQQSNKTVEGTGCHEGTWDVAFLGSGLC